MNKLKNLILKLLYRIFNDKTIKLDISDRELVFSDDFINLDNFNIKDNEFYNNNDVWFEKESVSLNNDGLHISCKLDGSTHESWQGIRSTKWKSGMIDTMNKFEYSKGLWVITAKLNGGWPAIWLLKKGRQIDGYVKDMIIPEIDIVEPIHGKFRHTIHWGYSDEVYRTQEYGSNICKFDYEFHEFAVDILDNGYDFYIDGHMTASFRSNDTQFTTNDKNYLLINGANSIDTNDDNDIIIRSIKVYESR